MQMRLSPVKKAAVCNGEWSNVRNGTNASTKLGSTTGEVKLSTRRVDVRPRERLIDAAYELFSKDGVSQVGIDTILAKSGCAKASLYTNFKTKVELAIAFLDRRETVWTRGWLELEIKRRATSPEARLLAIFDVFDGWFHKKSFEGCSFINVLLEFRPTALSVVQPAFISRRSALLCVASQRRQNCGNLKSLRRRGIC